MAKSFVRIYENAPDAEHGCSAQRDKEWGIGGFGFHVLMHDVSVFASADENEAQRVYGAFARADELGFLKRRRR